MAESRYLYQHQDGTRSNQSYTQNADGRWIAGNILGLSDGNGGYIDGSWRGSVSAMPGGTAAPAQSQPQPQSAASQFGMVGGTGGGGSNPYLQDQANGIQQQVTQNLQQNIMPGIRSSALASGQYGGSRQGIAEGVAAGNASAGISNSLANLYSNAYNTDRNYNLGLGSLANNATAQNQNFYTQQRGQDLQQYQLGATMYGGGITGQVGVGSGQYGVGNSAYQAPLSQLQQYSNMLSPYSGLGGQQVSTGSGGGNAFNSAIGGALAGGQIANNLGLGSSAGSSGTFQQGAMGAAMADKSWQSFM